MTTEALAAAGFDPTGLAGGRVESWGGNARIGGDRLFVVEADEFDQAFLELDPAVAVVTNVEPEHLECYDGSVERMEEAFAEFAGRAETVLIGTADAGSDRVARRLATRDSRLPIRVWRYGPEAGDLALTATKSEVEKSEARVRLPDTREVSLRLRVPGRHNLANATAALGVVLALGGAIEPALAALERFSGVGRRFERLGEAGGVAVVDDYAHHPTEIAATLEAARQAFPGRRVVAVFQPHLYSRTGALAGEMGAALVGADLVWVTEVYAAREAPVRGVSGRLVADAAVAQGAVAWFEGDRTRLSERVLEMLRPGDVVLTLGAGDITTLAPALLQALGGESGGGER
jgi:UDP-N-acetylmuramate--alanine ligase